MKPTLKNLSVVAVCLGLIVFTSCFHSNNNTQQAVTTKTKSDSLTSYGAPVVKQVKKDTSTNYTYTKYEDNNDVVLKPYKIKFNFFLPRQITLHKPFQREEALKKLFPGHYYKLPLPADEKDTVTLVAWYCTDCPRSKFTNFISETVRFPLPRNNETRFVDTMRFTDENGKRNIILSLSTTEFTTELLPCGRFDGAVLSLAWFIEEDTCWRLKVFTPVVGYYGSFQSLPKMKLLKLGKNNFGCWLDDCNGPGGGPFYCTMSVFGLVDSSFKEILQYFPSGQSNAFVSWGAEPSVSWNDSLNFNELVTHITGTYNKGLYDSAQDEGSIVPNEIKKYAKKKKQFNFLITNYFQFINGKYVYKRDEVSFSKF